MLTNRRKDQLYLIGVREQAIADGRARITFFTTRGDLEAYARVCRPARQGVILLSGDEDETGFDRDFDQMSSELSSSGISSLRIDYRYPGDYAQCAIDALLACQYLDDEGISDVLLVGWSFGAGVALAAGAVARNVRGVAAISPMDVPDCCVRGMSRKSLLVASGETDELGASEQTRRVLRALENRTRLLTYSGQGHDLMGVRRQLRADLMKWISCTFDSFQPSKQDAAVGAWSA